MSLQRTLLAQLLTSPPAVLSATVLADGITLRLAASKPVTGTADLGLTRSVSSISSGAISDVNIDLTVPAVLAGSDAGTIAYDAATGDLTGADGDVFTFAAMDITNNSTQVVPVVSSATVLADGVTLRLVCTQSMTGTAALGFTRSVDSITSGTISTTHIDLVVPTVLIGADAGTLDYDSATGDLTGTHFDLASFTAMAITNNSTQVA